MLAATSAPSLLRRRAACGYPIGSGKSVGQRTIWCAEQATSLSTGAAGTKNEVMSDEDYDDDYSSESSGFESIDLERKDQATKARFDRFDTNSNGLLEEGEVAALLETLGCNTDGDETVIDTISVFGKFDDDKNGTLELPEFEQMWRFMHEESGQVPEVRTMFDTYDLDGKGVLDRECMARLLFEIGYRKRELDSQASVMFNQYNMAGDDLVTFEELQSMWDWLQEEKERLDAESSDEELNENKRLLGKVCRSRTIALQLNCDVLRARFHACVCINQIKSLNEAYVKELTAHYEDVESSAAELARYRKEIADLRERIQIVMM